METAAIGPGALLQATKSSLFILSTCIGLTNPALAKQIDTVGNASVGIWSAVTEYTDAMAKLGDRDGAAKALTGAVLAGNLVGAVMTIVPLFRASGPTPDQLILEQVGKLREEVGQLHSEMHERFDRIDEALNGLFDAMLDGFGQFRSDIRLLDEQVAQLGRELLSLHADLDRLGRRLWGTLKAGFDQQLWLEIGEALGYRQRTGEQMAYREYTAHESHLHTWSTENCFNDLAVGGPDRSYREEDVAEELAFPLEANVRYLSRFISAKAVGTGFATSPAPNLEAWSVAARAYAQLLSSGQSTPARWARSATPK